MPVTTQKCPSQPKQSPVFHRHQCCYLKLSPMPKPVSRVGTRAGHAPAGRIAPPRLAPGPPGEQATEQVAARRDQQTQGSPRSGPAQSEPGRGMASPGTNARDAIPLSAAPARPAKQWTEHSMRPPLSVARAQPARGYQTTKPDPASAPIRTQINPNSSIDTTRFAATTRWSSK
jgi:hypothetical protein